MNEIRKLGAPCDYLSLPRMISRMSSLSLSLTVLIFLISDKKQSTSGELISPDLLLSRPSPAPTAPRGNFSGVEYNALWDLYNSTSGETWHWYNEAEYGQIWQFVEPPENPCLSRWQGIVCECSYSLNECFLTEINLESYNLIGTLPSSISNFQHLTVFNVSDNYLVGKLPSSWSSMNLQTFLTSYNYLDGTLPNFLWTLTDLVVLDVHDNQLNGNISSSIGNLTKLVTVELSENYFSGTFPSVMNLKQLEYLDLESCLFMGNFPNNWGHLNKLLTMNVRSNFLHGGIPTSLASLPLLTTVNLAVNVFMGTLPTFSSRFLIAFNAQRNFLEGTIPDTFLTMKSLRVLDLGYNKLEGTLPTLASNLSLVSLRLTNNSLTGTLPASLWEQSQLLELYLKINRFRGSLSDKIGNLKALLVLSVARNAFTGVIPTGLYSLLNLEYLGIAENMIAGTISNSISQLESVQWLNLGYNMLTGTIPVSIGHMSNLSHLILAGNRLSGTLPASLGNLHKLNFLFLSDNHLSGTVPLEFTKLENLEGIIMFKNMLTGSPYSALSAFPKLLYFANDENLFHGPAPMNRDWRRLLSYTASYNFFSGPIPLRSAQTKFLFYVDIGYNAFSGTLPSWISEPTLNYFYGDYNYIHGTIPTISTGIVEVFLEHGHLSGQIPNSIGNCSHMTTLRLNYNWLTGTFPKSLATLPRLETLFLHFNNLRGTVNHIFQPAQQPYLAHVDISNNDFTGTIPRHLFLNSTSLLSFGATSNCLSGSLPEEMCTASALQTLSLDGLSTTASCRKPVLSGILGIKAFTLIDTFTSTIPPCLFAMQSLQSLHISGNGLTGTLPSDLAISPSLINVSISNNKLSGPLPTAFLQRQFLNLDIAYNKFSGTLASDATSIPGNGSFFAQRNRFSGPFPNNMLDSKNISALDGNLFSCSFARTNLPKHDPKYPTYTCGSDEVNRSLLVWAWFWPLFAAIAYFVLSAVQKKQAVLSPAGNVDMESGLNRPSTTNELSHDTVDKDPTDAKDSFSSISLSMSQASPAGPNPTTQASSNRSSDGFRTSRFRSTNSKLTALTCWEAVQTFHERSQLWRAATYDNDAIDPEKRDLLSSLRMMRKVCMILTLVCVLVLLPTFSVLSTFYRSYENDYIWSVSGLIMSGRVPAVVLTLIFSGMMLCTWILIQRERGSFFDSIEKDGHWSQSLFYLSFFIVNFVTMLLLNVGYVLAIDDASPALLFLIESGVAIIKVAWNEIFVIRLFTRFKHLFFQYGLTWRYSLLRNEATLYDFIVQNALIILNLVVLPIVALAFASTNCLYNIIKPPATVAGGFTIEVCDVSAVVGTHLVCLDSTESYKTITYDAPFIYSNQCSSFVVINYSSVYIYFMIIVSFFIPMTKAVLKLRYDRMPLESPWRARLHKILPRVLRAYDMNPAASEEEQANRTKPLFEKKILPIRLNSYLSLLLIFGVCFPPMAIPIFLGIMVVVSFEELVLGKLLYEAQLQKNTWYRDRIRAENHEALRYLTNPLLLWFLLSAVALIYAFLVFDVMGDARGVAMRDAAIPAAMVVIFPTIILLSTILWQLALARYQTRQRNLRFVSHDVSGQDVRTITKARANSLFGGGDMTAGASASGIAVEMKDLSSSSAKSDATGLSPVDFYRNDTARAGESKEMMSSHASDATVNKDVKSKQRPERGLSPHGVAGDVLNPLH